MSEPRTHCYTRHDIKWIFRRCRQNPAYHWLYAIVVALAHTGLRISERRLLRWSHIDFSHGLIRLRVFGSTGRLATTVTSNRPKRP
ncbi:tyrosine-type recombinase/integrase [Caulifigura coniformis]|uniref:tyrosine-type recombinase/integrase n=1 Tax=Caulifigura coniformis TaxID=2527983 RepID=UPI00119DA06A